MKITIITVCFNAGENLKNTIKSILNQTYNDIEWVVVDGKSTDNTKEVIEKNEAYFKAKGIYVNFKSEKDNGIYDAMNKGIVRASGEWCIFMNAGDTFYTSNALKELVIDDIEQFDIIYGDSIHAYVNKQKLYVAKEENKLSFIKGMEFCHQSTLIRKKILNELKYNTNYSIAGDYDFFVKAYKRGVKFKHITSIIAQFEMDGISSSNAIRVNMENNEVKFKYNLISKKEYKKNKQKLRASLWLRNIVPKKIILKRQEIIMNNATKNWDDLNRS